jgi:hypothetical protein
MGHMSTECLGSPMGKAGSSYLLRFRSESVVVVCSNVYKHLYTFQIPRILFGRLRVLRG